MRLSIGLGILGVIACIPSAFIHPSGKIFVFDFRSCFDSGMVRLRVWMVKVKRSEGLQSESAMV